MNTDSDFDSFTPAKVSSWAERNGFAHWVVALIWLVVALIGFQVTAAIVFGILIAVQGTGMNPADIETSITNNIDLLFIGNSVGQILVLAVATFLIARLNLETETKASFLRIKWNRKVMRYILLGSVLVVVIQPLIIYLGYLNSLIPLPEYMSDLQISQYQMIEDFLTSDGILLFGLLNIALVPSICEELLFRGYILRSFEKSWGAVTAVVVSGIIFGMFHIQLGNLLPLATLGIVLGLMTWLSGALWPAVVAHFINNGAAVLLGSRFPEIVFREVSAETLPPIWVLIVSIALTGSIIYAMFNQSSEVKRH